jgi:molecular chaperone GrpE (heat shock protein)
MRRESDLLSAFCSSNNIYDTFTNFTIKKINLPGISLKNNYDLLSIVDGITTAFLDSVDVCASKHWATYKGYTFQRTQLPKNHRYFVLVPELLGKFDVKIGSLLLSHTQHRNKQLQQGNAEPEKAKTPDITIRMHDSKHTDQLNQLAEKRIKDDVALTEKIQSLQMSLQDELKQIMEIREGIDYNTTEEAIRQFMELYSLLSDILQYHHPNKEENERYCDLVDSCEDFLECIVQSLAILGVMLINDPPGTKFDSERHKSAHNATPQRQNIITRVVKIGFAYKNKVLEKATVELT